MAAAAGQVFVNFSHKGGDDAQLVGNFLYTGFKKDRPIGSLQYIAVSDGSFINTGPGFGMEPLNRHIEFFQVIKNRSEKIIAVAAAQDGIAEHAWRKRC